MNLILLKYEQLVRDCKNNVRLSVFTACEKEHYMEIFIIVLLSFKVTLLLLNGTQKGLSQKLNQSLNGDLTIENTHLVISSSSERAFKGVCHGEW